MARPHLPAHLNHLVVEQDYGQYNAQDQAVWRFVVLQTHARLQRTAHAAYADGFAQAGISAERIPEIAVMSERLAEIGWSAVCVDGFIPPRAFQAFQAASVLPIAADIRTSRHLTYTPAPDIIHEAAGHAPFLADPGYARFLRRIGEIGGRAFSSRYDRELYDAIHLLSEVKEDPASSAECIASAEQAFDRLTRRSEAPSEAAKVARLYWWTVEYGLVGALAQPRLYGAGLLSSIGEGHFCLGPGVEKRPLTGACIDVAYDITRAQPQLFVADSFEQLDEVLDEVASRLSQCVGGLEGLTTACLSEELATLTLDSGAQIVGVVSAVHADAGEPWLVSLRDSYAVADGLARTQDYHLPLGSLEDGTLLSQLDRARLTRLTDARGRIELRTRRGVSVTGVLRDVVERDGRPSFVSLAECEITARGRVFQRASEPVLVALGSRVQAVAAGAPAGHEPATAPTDAKVPRARRFAASEREVLALYDRARAAFRDLGGGALEFACADVVHALDAAHPNEWLLRWNILESLVKAGEGAALQGRLEADLHRLERHFGGREPIETGLAYLRELADGATATVSDASRRSA